VQHNSILTILDLRRCNEHESVAQEESFVHEMTALGFVEELRGFFRRSARWREGVTTQLTTTFDPNIGSAM
jgi:hypothetical protein